MQQKWVKALIGSIYIYIEIYRNICRVYSCCLRLLEKAAGPAAAAASAAAVAVAAAAAGAAVAAATATAPNKRGLTCM